MIEINCWNYLTNFGFEINRRQIIPIIENNPVATILKRIEALKPTCSGMSYNNNNPDRLASTTPKPAGIIEIAPIKDETLKITVKSAKDIEALTEFSKKYAPRDSKLTTLIVSNKLIPKNFGFSNEKIIS